MRKEARKSAALKSNLITKYHACYHCYNIQYEMCETSTEIYMRVFSQCQTIARSKQFRLKTTQKRIVRYITLILTLPLWLNAKSMQLNIVLC